MIYSQDLLKEFKLYLTETKEIEERLQLPTVETYCAYYDTAEEILKDFMLWKTDKKAWLKDWEETL